MSVPQDELGHRLIEASVTCWGDVRFGGLAAQNDLLSAADGTENRRFAQVIAVDAHSQIDFPRIRITSIQAHETEDWVGRKAFQTLQHHISPSPRPLRGGRASLAGCD